MEGNLNDLLKDMPLGMSRIVARYGVKIAIDLLQTLYADLGGERETEEAPPKRGRGRPRKVPEVRRARRAGTSGWPADPAARSREMKRRIAVAREKKLRAKQSSGAKTRWDRMTKAQREKWLQSMQRGRQARQHGKREAEAA